MLFYLAKKCRIGYFSPAMQTTLSNPASVPASASTRRFRVMQSNRVQVGDFVRLRCDSGLFQEVYAAIRHDHRSWFLPVITPGKVAGRLLLSCPESLVEVAC